MSKVLGLFEIDCDAPRYAIVQASRRLGLRAPEDVRWCRIRNLLSPKVEGTFLFHIWQKLWRWQVPVQRSCSCGQRFPDLKNWTFHFNTGETESLILGQCDRCRSIFWDEVDYGPA